MPEMLLFGAGASQEADVPTAYGLTQKIADEFRNKDDLKRHSHLVSFVLGGLLFNAGIQGKDPLNSGVNVEEFFNAIQLLADRNSLEAAPFVGSWHSMVEEFDTILPPTPDADRLQEIIFRSVSRQIYDTIPSYVSSMGARDIDRNLDQALRDVLSIAKSQPRSYKIPSANIGKEVGEYVTDIIKNWIQRLKGSHPNTSEFRRAFMQAIDQQPRPGEGKIYRDVAALMIQMLVRFVFVEDAARVTHLGPLVDLVKKQPRVVIATLNYDNCVELFCEANSLRCDTGIDEWSKSGNFDVPEDGIVLLKLHGSIDWQSNVGKSSDRPMPIPMITKVNRTLVKKGEHRPAVIFGSKNKLTADGPFLDLLRAFQHELSQSDRLTIVGYSFADAHINTYISQWINSNPTHKLRVIGRSFGDKRIPYADELLANVRDRVEIVKCNAGEGLKRTYCERKETST